MFRSTAGQVTVFIVLGIIIVLTVATLLYFQYAFEKPIQFEISQEPVTAYVQQCMIDVTQEALLLAGQTGGHLYQEELDEEEKELTTLLPFNSDTLLLANGKQQLPYWYYQKNDGIDQLNIPELEKQVAGDNSIQDQIEHYIAEHLNFCLDSFEGLEEAGIAVAAAGEFIIGSTITEKSIEVELNYPLDITTEGTTTQQNIFTVVVPTGLKRTYDLARDITEHELNTLFLEQTTRNLIATYGQVDNKYLPPIAGGLHFEQCSERVYWFYPDVKNDFQTMLAANIPYLKIASSDFGRITVTRANEPDEETREQRQAVFDHFVQSISATDYSDLSVNFQYQTNYPLELYFGNNLGYGIIQPNALEMNILIANLCMFEYSFLYNVKYPVVVSVVDPYNPIDGNAFVFQFPLQVVVKNNYPRIKLNDVLRAQFQIPEIVAEPSYQCAATQRLSGESTVQVIDSRGVPVENALLSFQCGPSYVYDYDINGTLAAVHQFGETCFMGNTDTTGALTTTYPPCIGAGVITVQHQGYVEKSVASGDILQGRSFEKTIVLDKVYSRELKIQKYFVAPPAETNQEGIGVHFDDAGNIIACNLNMDPKEFQPYESAIVSVTKLDPENGVLNTATTVVYEVATGEPTMLDIAAGVYYVDIMLLREERYAGEMTIEANSEAIEVSTTFGTETITYPEEDLLIPQTFTGGAAFVWEVSAEELENSNAILFSVFDEGVPKTVEQVSAPLLHREACSALQSTVIKPKLQ